jgi:hypothetical protein
MLDFLIGAVLLLLGGAAGYALRMAAERRQRLPEPEAPGERERERLREDRQAFETLMGYNSEMAYGQAGAGGEACRTETM